MLHRASHGPLPGYSRSVQPLIQGASTVKLALLGYNAAVSEVTIRLHVEPLEEGGYVATSPDVPGLVAEGRSIAETVEIAQDVARVIAECCLEHGDPLPAALLGLNDGPIAVDLLVPVSIP